MTGSTATAAATASGRPAGFWRRLAALIIDTWAVFVGTLAVDTVWGVVNDAHLLANGPAAIASGASQLALVAAYYTVCWGWRGQTVGYVLLEVRISARDGGRVGYPRAFLRWLLLGLSFALVLVPALVSLILVAVPGSKRALHDRLVGTRVVRLQPDVASWIPESTMADPPSA